MTREERWTIRKNSDEPYDTRGASIIGPRTDPRTVKVVPAARLAEVEAERDEWKRRAELAAETRNKIAAQRDLLLDRNTA